MTPPKPANDPTTWDMANDRQIECGACESPNFMLRFRGGFTYVVCSCCEADVTNLVFGDPA